MAVATFDGPNLRIILPASTSEVDVERDIYSAWKQWALLSDNAKYPPAFRTVGGDALTPGIEAGAYFFIQNQDGWRIRPAEEDATVNVVGNLAPEDSSVAILTPTLGNFQVLVNGLQPITQSVESLLLEQQNTAYEGAIHIDTISGEAGTESPIGTASRPVNNLVDAAAIIAERGFTEIFLTGSIVLDRAFAFFHFVGDSGVASIDVNGQDVSGTFFENVAIQGDFSAVSPLTPVRIFKSLVAGDITDFVGLMGDTLIGGNISLAAGQTSLARCGSNVPGSGRPEIDFQGNAADLSVRGYIGGLLLRNMTNAASDVTCDLNGGRLELENTVTAGTIVVGGIGNLVDGSGGTAVVSKNSFVDGLDVKLIKALDAGNVTITGSSPFVVEVLDPDDNVTVIARFEVSADGRTRTRTL